jgi:multiple sugar transport system permease protein
MQTHGSKIGLSRRKIATRLWGILLTLVTWIILALFLIPTLWIPLTSLRPEREIAASPPVWVPQNIHLDNYWQILGTGGSGGASTMARYAENSVIVSVISIVAALFIGTIAGYVLSRFSFRGRTLIFFSILSVRVIPPLVMGVPLFILYRRLDLYDTRIGLILVYTALAIPFATWLMETFFAEVPKEITEAALVDGSTKFQVFRYVAVPMAKTGLATTAIFIFITTWSEFALALSLTGSQNARTLPVALYQFVGEFRVAWGPLTAAGTILLIPAVVFTATVQRHLARGLTFGAVKG